MSFVKSKGFKYLKNLAIGVGAAIVLMGALFKIESWEGASTMLIIGLTTEAIIFLVLGILGPEKDYYWEKLYPGLDQYDSRVQPLSASMSGPAGTPLDGEAMNSNLNSMLTELQGMHKNLSSLKALQEVDFSGTSDQIKSMNNFYAKMTEAMADLSASSDDVRAYKDQMAALNKNLGSLNSVYGNMLSAMANIGK
jgi:hypothetical protein